MIKFLDLQNVNYLIDQHVLGSNYQTIFLSKKFLNYHYSKFKTNFLIFSKNNTDIFGIPVSINGNILNSHPGTSYGGIIKLTEEVNFKNLFYEFVEELINNKYELKIKLPHRSLIEEKSSIYNNLIHQNMKPEYTEEETIIDISNCDYTNTTNCNFNKGHKTEINRFKNRINYIFLQINEEKYSEYYQILVENTLKFNKAPTHSFEEFVYLHNIFPDHIKTYCVVEEKSKKIIAGVTIFKLNLLSVSAFYSTFNYKMSSEFKGSLKFVYWQLFDLLQREGFKYFNFGIDVTHGNPPSKSLRYFKNGFGGFQLPRFHYCIK